MPAHRGALPADEHHRFSPKAKTTAMVILTHPKSGQTIIVVPGISELPSNRKENEKVVDGIS